jgi:hypothetical protein
MRSDGTITDDSDLMLLSCRYQTWRAASLQQLEHALRACPDDCTVAPSFDMLPGDAASSAIH